MPSQTSRDARAWTVATLGSPVAWTVQLNSACWSLLDSYIRRSLQDTRPVTDLRLSEADQAACARELQPAIVILENRCGFAVIDRLPLERYSTREAQALYWLIGQGLGRLLRHQRREHFSYRQLVRPRARRLRGPALPEGGQVRRT